jgi:alpha-beta hydrolase superfamily lysophospholipase
VDDRRVSSASSSQPERPAAEAPRLWRFAPDAWRASKRLNERRIDLYLKLRGGKAVPRSIRARIRAMRIPDEQIYDALSQVRGLGDWMGVWNQIAQQFLGDARRQDIANRLQEAAVSRRNAAMCYHVAHFVTDTDPRTVRALKAAGVAAFAQAIPQLMPETRRVLIAWRASQLPAYLAKPAVSSGDAPLVVLLNGMTTTKEEMILWSDRFLANGVAVLALDWPGTGEAATGEPLSPDCDDITDGLISFIADEPGLDPAQVVLCGFSLGGSLAIRATALDRRIAGAIAVTPPYEPRGWIGYVNSIIRQQLVALAVDDELAEAALDGFSLADVMPRFRAPLLVFGAARDLTVPPEESLNLAAAAGDLATLVWYPEGSHGLYEYLEDWTEVAARWTLEVTGGPRIAPSTQVESNAT